MRLLLAIVALTFSAVQAVAGAWPREEGAAFLSFATMLTTDRDTLLAPDRSLSRFTSVYAEYGLAPALTVGIDASLSRDDAFTVSTVLGFARVPVWRNDAGHIVSAEMGLGTLDEDGERQMRLRPGISWGRGFESRWGGGWMGVDASAEMRLPRGDWIYKADGTIGLKPTERWMLILQLQSGRYPGAETILRLAPSIVRQTGKRSNLQLGLTAGLAGDPSIGVKLASWFSF